MRKLLPIQVKETLSELKSFQKQYPGKLKALQMLIHLKRQGPLPILKLAKMTGVSDHSIHRWRKAYMKDGISSLLRENRGGHKKAAINIAAEKKLSARLHDPKQGFRSFGEMQQWLLSEFGIEMKYHALNKYVKRKYGARLKVSRKSHVLKSPADEAVFKKPV